MDSLRAFGRCKLLVHKRRVGAPGGEVTEEAVVACPQREQAMTLEQCAGCADYEGRSFDCEHDRSFVVCTVPGGDLPVPAHDARVADIMKPHVLCVDEDLSRSELASLFEKESVTSAPVIDASRRAVGILSSMELLRAEPSDRSAAEMMTPLVFSVSPRTRVSEAAALMAFEHVHQLPVVSDDERVVGLITALDVVRWVARNAGFSQDAKERP